MEAPSFTEAIEAMEAMEAQEYLRELRVSDWPQIKEQVRNEEHKKTHQKAFPFNKQKAVKTTDLQNIFGLK